MIGVGLSQNADTRAAVREAFDRARFSGDACWVLAVAGRRHDAETVFAAIRELLPAAPVYGGACVGAIGANRIGYSGYEIALAVFDDSLGQPDVFVVEPIMDREHEAGRELGAWLAGRRRTPGALLFYDVTREGGGINIGSRLLDGVYAELPETGGPPVFGAGLIADFQVTASFLFDGDGVRRNAALALRFPENLEIRTRVMHGCTPVSTMLEVTRAEGARIHELDGRPAVEVLRELAGAKDGDELALAFSVLLGRRAGD
ncbi:MAG TPA: FIST N-terminal domain-containing protein, partial [Gammaproteobacteria bacterium]